MSLALAACGGGDGTSTGPFGPSISLSADATSATSISLSWSAPSGGISVSSYNVRFATIALDSSDNPLIAYKQDIYDSSLNETRIPL